MDQTSASNEYEQLLTATEVGQRLRVGKETVTGWARAKVVPFGRLHGGHLRFRESDIPKMIEWHDPDGSAVQADGEVRDDTAVDLPSPADQAKIAA